MRTPQLSADDRELFHLVSRAAFANPFGDERDRVDRELAGRGGREEDILDRAVARVRRRLETLGGGETVRFDALRDRDAELVQHAIVFDVFHRWFGGMDAHIATQRAHGKAPVRAAFGPPMLAMLESHGFDRQRALRLVGVFFQMARAYFFIARSLLGASSSMRRLREALWNGAVTRDVGRYEARLVGRMDDFSTIVLGETGTGKGAAAQALGRSGFIPYDDKRERFTHAFTSTFLALNLSEFSESLVESELFGHAKGAFTGALAEHEGALSRSGPHGVVFLDEIGEVSIPVQIKLLRVLQERSFHPVGSRDEKTFAGRVIAATHRDVDRLRREGRLRDDFYYRLSSDVVIVPTLRERLDESPGELDALVAHLCERILGAPAPEVASDVSRAIERDLGRDHPWPGNVRELEQCVRRVLLTGACRPASHAAPTPTASWLDAIGRGDLPAEQLLALYCAELHRRHGTYEKVAAITGLDRRTVKKHVTAAAR
ncbi:MAG: sigma-54-dependent Fis family transcriptional regulator [Deltaproteobacteria bacterium]|nr:sigma-54-dependent Fis family transcriptional regulator [Deltaproteobacteria bacterium]